jgi:membrane protease YdiL (CAAX protease family)
LAGGLFPLLAVFLTWVLAYGELRRKRQGAEEARWARRLVALAALDLLAATGFLVLLTSGATESVSGLSGPAARAVPAPRIGILFEPDSNEPRVHRVLEGTPAERAGLREGDRVEAIDGTAVTTREALAAAIRSGEPGRARRLTVRRDGVPVEIEVRTEGPLTPAGLFDRLPDGGPAPGADRLAVFVPPLAAAALTTIRARRLGAPRVPVWRGVLVTLAAASAAALGTVYGMKAALGGWTVGGLLLGLLAQMLVMAGMTRLCSGWLGPVAEPPPERRLSSLRATLQGLYYIITGLPRVAVVLAAASVLLGEELARSDVLETIAGMRLGPAGVALFLLTVAGVGPVAEEMLFRGFVLPRLSARLGPGWGLWVSSAVFALLHYSYGFLLPVVLLYGLVFGWARRRTGRLAAPVALHVLVNGVVSAVYFLG